MTSSPTPDIYWNPTKKRAWHRGFEIRIEDGVGNHRKMKFYTRHKNENVSGLVLIETHTARITGDVEKQLKGKTAFLLQSISESFNCTPIDGVPWEIHQISNSTARHAATKAYLLTAEVSIGDHVLHWPPFTESRLKLIFPTGDITKPEVKWLLT